MLNASTKLSDTIIKCFDKHAPIKTKKMPVHPAPYMNSKLRKAIFQKRMQHNKFQKCRTSRNWENYRKARNLVTKIKKQSIQNYFLDRCTGGCKDKDF